MLVWLVNPFDPLPGEKEQLRRYTYLASSLRGAGHQVVWWSSDFSHRFKRAVDADAVARAAEQLGISVRLIRTQSYRGNASVWRLWSHNLLARCFRAEARRCEVPDLIVGSSPPLELAAEVTRLGREWGRPTIIDIQDQWPDNFVHIAPRATRPFSRFLLSPLYATERTAYREATAIVGVADRYRAHGLQVGGPKAHDGVFHLGLDLEDLRAAMLAGAHSFARKWNKKPGELWLLYSGSISYNYDVMTIVHAARSFKYSHKGSLLFLILGKGELTQSVKQLIDESDISNVKFIDFLDYEEYAFLLSKVDIGFNASFPDSLIFFPNKMFYYLGAGLAVLNTIGGECGELVSTTRCGLNYMAGDVGSCCEAIRYIIDHPAERCAMQAAAREVAQRRFDRPVIYNSFVTFIEEVAASSHPQNGRTWGGKQSPFRSLLPAVNGLM